MMKRHYFFAASMFSAIVLNAQKNVDGLARAERSFAAYSVSHGMKRAFLQFADSSGILFNDGRPVNAIEYWNSLEERKGVLNWRPDYVEIAASHDFGFSTGPWTFQPKSLQDSVAGRGRFTTVWHVNQNGDWKFLVDLGVSNNPALGDSTLRKIEVTDPSAEPGDMGSLTEVERQFVLAARQSLKEAYVKFLSPRSIFTRHGLAPAKSEEEILTLASKSPQSLQYAPLGSGIASSGDLGYIYGSIVSEGKTENYLHIWRKEKEGWKIALEVLRL